MESAIEMVELSKRFVVGRGFRDLLPFRRRRYVEALRSVSLQIPRGGVFGILGPNGAGKTTMFKILGALILPTWGEVRVLGTDVARRPSEAKRVLTYVVTEERSLFWRITGRQNLHYFATLYGIPRRDAARRISTLLDMLDLADAADRRVMYYSTGMRQKLALARGLLPDPEILLLDEPTRSLDPLAARNLWRFIKEELVERGKKTILLATHNMEEARRECDRVAILHQGQVRACGRVGELTGFLGGPTRYHLALHPSTNGIHALLCDFPGVSDVRNLPSQEGHGHTFDMAVEDPQVQVPLLLERVIAAGGKVLACTPHERSLIDVLEELSGGQEP